MKVLWISNTLFPDVCNELGIAVPVVGGWMFSGANALLSENTNIQLGVASLYSGDVFRTMVLNGITYFLLPSKGPNKTYNPKLEIFWEEIKSQFCPDVVHMHGTEYPHGLAYLKVCSNKHVIVSIQGIVGVLERFYYGGITEKELQKCITFRDIIRNDTIFTQHTAMQSVGILEKEMILAVNHVIGRTNWDKAHIWAINSAANYHYNNETLREVFYQHKWEFSKCIKHSIFLSQAYYPLKGLHKVIEALPIILKHYPNTKVYVAGLNFFTNRGWRLTGYGKYILSLMKKFGVTYKVEFVGVLSEKEMCQKFLESHVFVCPSAIENSPNSIGEAQILGVPCVASYVGGIPDMIINGETGLLYRYEEVEMLAMAICQIFDDENLAKKLSVNSKIAASLRHDKYQNAKTLNDIYMTICKE